MYDKVLTLSRLDQAQARIETLARKVTADGGPPLAQELDETMALAKDLLRILLDAEGKPYEADADLLQLWKYLVKGEPHWNTIRDNCRELVYYRNCLDLGREDALPPQPRKMIVHTLRHLYLYLRSHCEQSPEETA
ncbi:MAG: hypothetical protein ACP5M3_04170 [Acidithiobacillus sp.]